MVLHLIKHGNKKEGGTDLQAYFAGFLSLQTVYRTQSDCSWPFHKTLQGYYAHFPLKNPITSKNKVNETDNPKAVCVLKFLGGGHSAARRNGQLMAQSARGRTTVQ